MPLLSQRELEEWFPTVIQYVGGFFMAVLFVASLFFGVHDYPGAFGIAAGMMLFKPWYRARKALQVAASSEDESDELDEERWSHMDSPKS